MIAGIAGMAIRKRHVVGPQGVRGRNSDNSRLRAVLGWEPEVPLERGLALTYAWIESQVLAAVAREHAQGRHSAIDLNDAGAATPEAKPPGERSLSSA
jgi:GDP-D-mannose 3', 5'-epimerase